MPGTTATYTTVRTASQWQFKQNGSVIGTVGLSSICWTPKRALWAGESWDRGDAIGGSSSNHVVVSSALYEATVGGIWGSPMFTIGTSGCTLSPTLARYKCNATSGQAVEFWTVQP